MLHGYPFTISMSVKNTTDKTLQLITEPWAIEYELAPGVEYTVVGGGKLPTETFFHMELHPDCFVLIVGRECETIAVFKDGQLIGEVP